jgi:hypothetical protein
MLAEKRNCIGVKLLAEANAIKAWRVATWAAFRWRFNPFARDRPRHGARSPQRARTLPFAI